MTSCAGNVWRGCEALRWQIGIWLRMVSSAVIVSWNHGSRRLLSSQSRWTRISPCTSHACGVYALARLQEGWSSRDVRQAILREFPVVACPHRLVQYRRYREQIGGQLSPAHKDGIVGGKRGRY